MKALGISFDNIHSYDDLDLFVCQDGISIPPAKAKTNYVDIAGGDGSLDLTEVHGEVKFSDRECEFTFAVNPSSDMTFEEKKTQVSNALNGKQCKIILDKDDEFYYFGRCSVDEYMQDKMLHQIVVTATVQPYKMKVNETVVSYELTGAEKTVNIVNSRKSVTPEVTCSKDNIKVVFGGVEKMLSAGTHKILDFQLKEGANTFKLSGSGTITFKYQEGEL